MTCSGHDCRLRAQIFFARGRPGDAQALLLDAANRLDALDCPDARDTYLEALGAAIFVGRLGEPGSAEEAAAAVRAAHPAPSHRQPWIYSWAG